MPVQRGRGGGKGGIEQAHHLGALDELAGALLRALIEGNAGILSLSIERAGLHDAFVAIAGEAAARALEENREEAESLIKKGRR